MPSFNLRYADGPRATAAPSTATTSSARSNGSDIAKPAGDPRADGASAQQRRSDHLQKTGFISGAESDRVQYEWNAATSAEAAAQKRLEKRKSSMTRSPTACSSATATTTPQHGVNAAGPFGEAADHPAAIMQLPPRRRVAVPIQPAVHRARHPGAASAFSACLRGFA